MLYHPTPDEITPLLEKARRRWPPLRTRIDLAANLLNAFDLASDNNHFTVLAKAAHTDNSHYVVHILPGPRCCSCRDFQQTHGPTAGGLRFCAHLITIQAYIELLRTHLARRLIGSTKDPALRRYSQTSPNTYLARIGYTRTVTTIDAPTLIIQTTFGARGSTFATDADAITFSHWLSTAEPVPGHEADLLFPLAVKPSVR